MRPLRSPLNVICIRVRATVAGPRKYKASPVYRRPKKQRFTNIDNEQIVRNA
jgi:hypothetical protein